jgi:hypothetical protein
VHADFAVELGPDDETLEFPWMDESGRLRYYDLKRHPEQLRHIEEAQREPALKEFLTAINAASTLETAKCDAWPSTEINGEEEIFGATHKFGSYVDLLFADEQSRLDFATHEDFAQRLTALLRKVPEMPASAEFLIRRCYFRSEPQQTGFYITLYLFGYGNDEAQAHQRWVIGSKLVENAIRQMAVEVKR